MRSALCVSLILCALPAQADTSTSGKRDSVAESVWASMLPVIADAAEEDRASPVKGPRTVWKGSQAQAVEQGIRNFQGSNTLVRAALSYGILRAGGFGVSQPWAVGGEQIGSALAFFEPKNQQNLEAAFHTLFGRALVKKRTGAGEQTRFAYDGASLQAAFDALYVAPDASIGKVRARLIYDTLFKDYLRQKAEAIATLLQRKGLIARAARDWQAQSARPGFDGVAFQAKLLESFPEPLKYEGRLVGTLVRRHADGTLPVVLKALRRVLGDYDPKTLERLDSRLKAPAA